MKLSLIIPCYNESKNLPLLAERCENLLSQNVEIILVNNGSTDNSAAVLAQLQQKLKTLRIVTVPANQGYGFGIVSGLNAATGDILAWTHADMQTDPADALIGFDYFKDNFAPETVFVKGKRRGRPLADVMFTIGMALFEMALLRARMWDINAQPTMFHRSFYAEWKNPPSDFSLDLYAYYLARKNALKIQRFRVHFGKRAHGTSHWNINWQSKLKFIRRTLSYSIKLKKQLAE